MADNRTATLSIRLTPAELQAWKQSAWLQHMTVSEWVRVVVEAVKGKA